MAFRWRAEDDLLIVVFGLFLSLPHQLKKEEKKTLKVGPPLTNNLDPPMAVIVPNMTTLS